MTKKFLLAALVLALAAGGWVLFSQRAQEQAPAKPKGPAEQAVGVVKPKLEDVPVVLEVNGTVVSLKTVEVRAQTSNLIKKIHVKEGQFVRQGKLLFSLDDRADRANFEKLQAQLARNQALAADYERQYQRARDLRAQNFISQSALDSSQTQWEAQTAALAADRAALQAAQLSLDYDRIVAPASGRLGSIAVFEGSLVQAGGAPLLAITQVDPVAVQFSVPESSLASLHQALSAKGTSAGAAAGVKAGVSITLPGTTQPMSGKLYFADSTVDAATGTIKSKAEFANPGMLLWPGQFVPTRLQLQTLQAVNTLPINALVTSINGKFVYVVDAENTAQQKPVKVLHTYGARMVVEGVRETDQVIVDGKQNLRPGSKVRLISANTGSAAPKTEASTKP